MSKNVNLLSIFAKNMRGRRKKAKLTQKDLAIKCGISSSFITDIELGKKAPSFLLHRPKHHPDRDENNRTMIPYSL